MFDASKDLLLLYKNGGVMAVHNKYILVKKKRKRKRKNTPGLMRHVMSLFVVIHAVVSYWPCIGSGVRCGWL